MEARERFRLLLGCGLVLGSILGFFWGVSLIGNHPQATCFLVVEAAFALIGVGAGIFIVADL